FDPLRVPDLLRDSAESGKDPEVSVRRGQELKTFTIPRKDLEGRGTWAEIFPSQMLGNMAIPALGISYDVLPKIARVEPESPGAAAGLRPGDEITSISYYASPETKPVEKVQFPKDNWAFAFWLLQVDPVDNKVDITFRRQGEEKTASLVAKRDTTWYLPSHAFR